MNDSIERHNQVFEPQQAKPPSVSSQVYKYLCNDVPEDATLTVETIRIACGLPESDQGAVSGFVSRMARKGVLKQTGVTENGVYAYKLGDLSVKVFTKKVRGVGGHHGARKSHKHVKEPVIDAPAEQYKTMLGMAPVHPRWAHTESTASFAVTKPTIKDLAERLFNLSVELSALAAETTLATATKPQLLEELNKRMK